jgi:hypothetical protein
VALACLAARASAQTGPSPGTFPPPTPPGMPGAAVSPGPIPNNDSLAAMLRGLGYEVQTRTWNTDNGPRSNCLVVIRRDGYTYVFEAELMGPNNRNVWLIGLVGSVDLDRASPSLLARLLEENKRHGPLHFSYRKGDRKLLLNLCLENRDLTPERLRAEVERLLRVIRETQPTWGAIGASASVQQPAPAPVPNQGTAVPPGNIGAPVPPAGAGQYQPQHQPR